MRASWSLLVALGAAACGAGGSNTGEPYGDVQLCKDAYAPQQLRLLTRREYDHTVRDLLGLSVDLPCTTDASCDLDVSSCRDGVCEDDPCAVHTFVFAWGGARSVHVAGTFNGWAGTVAEGGWALQQVPELGLWYTKRTLPEGEHAYKFVVDEAIWHHDPANPWTTSDGFSGFNSVTSVACEGGALAEPVRPSSDLPPESRPTGWFYDNHAPSGVVTSRHVEAYLEAAGELVSLVRGQLDEIVPCDRAQPACITTFVEQVGARVFRRPLTATEQARYVALAGTAEGDDRYLRALEGMLSSSSFLYRTEVGEGAGPDVPLTPDEVATWLAYFLWGSTPDEALRVAAAEGALDSAEEVAARARLMLEDPRARDHLGDFAVQWLGIERVSTVDKNPALFPQFTEAARAAAIAETRALFTEVVLDGEGTLRALLSSRVHHVNDALAPLYGLAVEGAELRPVEVAQRGASGVLGHVSVLAATAHSDQTSPVRRGLFVREHLLCQQLGAPPPDAGGVPEVDPNATTRERFAQHSDDPTCNACHRYVDPIGFGFEHYDPIGQWRDLDGDKPVDAGGSLLDVEWAGDGAVNFTSVEQLAGLLAESEAAHRCLTRELYRFGTGWEAPRDDCVVDALAKGFEQSGGDIKELIVAIASSPAVLRRRAEVAP
jgi:hypothetical protein